MDDLPKITVPTLVLVGQHEMPYLTIVAHVFAYYMPCATLTIIPGGGHLVNLEQPDAYSDAIAGFIDRTIGRT